MDFVKMVEEVIKKAKGSTAEAVAHDASEDEINGGTTKTSMGVSKTEKNVANKGTHPKNEKNINDRGADPEGGEDFQDGSEDTIGGDGKAEVMHPGVVKHEGGKKSSSLDLFKGKDEDKDDREEDDDDEDDDSEGDDHEDDDDDAEKSSDSEILYLDVDRFVSEVVAKAVAIVKDDLSKSLSPFIEESLGKSQESEKVNFGLIKSVDALADRISDIEKAVETVALAVSTRKSALTLSERDIAKSQYDESPTLSKSEINEKLLNKAMNGEIDHSVVLRFDASGDVNAIPAGIRKSIGL